MRRLTLGGVPLHPGLVHVPITLWLAAPALDAASMLAHEPDYWRLGWWCSVAGLLAAVPAMLAGALDAFASRRFAQAQDTVWRHAGLMSVAWTLFAVASVLAGPLNPPQASMVVVACHVLGALAVVVGAHAGGRLAHVYHLPAGEEA